MSVEHYPFPEENEPRAVMQIETPSVAVRHSESMGKLVAALAKAQLEFKAVLKQSENPAFRSKYADLATVIDATQESLAKQEVVVIQSPMLKGKELTLNTMLVHSSGEWISSDLSMPATMRERFDAQSVGTAISYARRYALQAILGVAGEDDDGNDASGQGSTKAAQAVAVRKIAEHKAKEAVGSLFWSWSDAEQQGYITGDADLLTANRNLLLYKGKYNRTINAIVVDASGLEDLKFELSERGVPFRQLKSTDDLTGKLEASIKQAAAKRDINAK